MNYPINNLPELKFDRRRKRIKNCPCGKNNKDGKFAPFIGYEDKGYCHSCGETFLPELSKIDYSENMQPIQIKSTPYTTKQIDTIPIELYTKQLINGKHLYKQNNFIQWLINTERGEYAFDNQTTQKIIETYMLGNSAKDKYYGWVLFPYIDIQGRLRDIKAINYNPHTGKRIREPNQCWFIGKELLKNPDANTERCYFGEHLIKGNTKQVKIFESEATATHAAPFFPKSICIATGGNNGLNWTDKDKCKVLQGRFLTLYPDIDAHDSWEEKAEILRSYGLKVQVSQLIRKNAIKYAEQNGISYNDLVKQKFDLRDILKFQKLKDFDISDSIQKTVSKNITTMNSIQPPPTLPGMEIKQIAKSTNPHSQLNPAAELLEKFIAKNPNINRLISVLDLDVNAARLINE